MAEQSGRDVVDQTLSGGEPSPSGVPASNNDKSSAGGDVGETQHIASASAIHSSTDPNHNYKTTDAPGSPVEEAGRDKDAGGSAMDISKQGTGSVASRALESNGLASSFDGGDDTASLGGSESDASRTDGRHHNRTGSVKKPTTFKPVSFAKFAVPKAPGATAAPKAPEKVPSTSTTPLGTPQPSSRPRLVAKTTAGMRDSFSKAGAGGGKSGASGPDPNQVWNKNRPVQPPPPKHLTDEELKQQYGIHMTSRIQADGGGTEAKWADIDDDEDDWAPETIEWTDGTKVTLTHTDHPPPPTDQILDQSKDAVPPPEQIVAKDSIKIAAPKPTISVGPNPTVLRLGANAERQAKAASISSKGTNDRVPSASTSPAPPPAKSPWAPLPPVERVSPVNPPVQVAQQPRGAGPVSYPPRDDVRHGQLPPQEIAADDFNRTWRETAPGAPRELYNSRSGRYEPVQDNRRGSWRHDQGPRPPAVLQRPNPVESGGPAEPSAAFQTHRSSHQEGMGWNRRRTSSNVSGGSGGVGRRMSFGRTDAAPPRYMDGRRGSQTNGMVDPALMGRENGPAHERPLPQQYAAPGWGGPGPRSASAASSVEQQQAAIASVPELPQEDPIVLQERIMKDARAQARQRRLEQEEKDRIEREERIKKKLAALGPPPEKPQPQRKESEGRKQSQSAESRKPPQTPAAPPPATLHSPPKPPVPEPTGEPKQYGMMKVHHPDAVKKLVAANERDRVAEKHPEKPASPSQARRVPPSPHEPTRELTTTVNTVKQAGAELQPGDALPDEHESHWRGNLNIPSSTYTPWSTHPAVDSNPSSIKNPWTLLNSDRTLGNGIFEQSLGGFPSREPPLHTPLGLDQSNMPPQAFTGPQESASVAALDPLSSPRRPGPIGPPASQQAAPKLGWANFQLAIAEQDRLTQVRARENFLANKGKANPHMIGVVTDWKPHRDASNKTAQKPAPEVTPGPGDLKNNVPPKPAPEVAPVPSGLKNTKWANFQLAIAEQDRLTQVRARENFLANKGKANPHMIGVVTDWKPHRDASNKTAQKPAPEVTPGPGGLKNNVPPSNPLTGLDVPTDGLPFTDNHTRSIASVPARSSRFFPQATEVSKRATAEKHDHQRSPSPPPPEEISTHPVYFGDSGRPLVHLPNPKPVVKLPPKALAAPATPAPAPTFASMAAAPPRGLPAPASTAISWQEKINGLLGKKTPVETKSALAITSATKEPLDVQLPAAAVSVSLPNIENGVQIGDGHFAVRQVEDQDEIFEDREPGSLPSVRVPNMAPANAWQAAPAPPPARLRAKVLKPMQVHSVEPYPVGQGEKDPAGNVRVQIRMPGGAAATSLSLSKKAGGPLPRQRAAPNFNNNKNRKGPKPRDASGSNAGPKKPSQQQSSTASSSPRHQAHIPW